MKSREWTQIGKPLNFIPNPPPKYNAILVPYPSSTVLYQNIVTASDAELLYENMKRTIAKECPGKDSNERELYHGTSGDAIEGIINQRYLEGAPSPSPFTLKIVKYFICSITNEYF